MANEIKMSLSIIYENGTLKNNYQPATMNIPQATKGYLSQTIAATTAEADVAVTGIGTPGLMVLHNLEATTTGKIFNWGLKSSTGGIPQYFKLPPKQIAQITYGTSAMVVRGKAASGTLSVQAILYEA